MMTNDPSFSPSRQRSLKYSRRLRAGGVVAGAALAATASASAAVVVTETDFDVAPNDYISFDPAGSSFVSGYNASFDAVVGACGSFAILSNGSALMNWATDGTGTLVTFTEGQVIDSGSVFRNASEGSSWLSGMPAAGETIHLGYRIDGQGAGNDESYYGYVRITGDETAAYTVDSYAFDDASGTGISVIPEPATTALGFGLFVLACMVGKRRFRRNKAS